MSRLNFKNKVAVVTGAGGGLGRAYALLLGERGASVVVNDLGGTLTGQGSDNRAADRVVNEIKAKGGIAVPNYDSVENGAGIIKTAIDNYGRVDILINNAGILRDVSFLKMKDNDWDAVMKVHVQGMYACSKAAWKYMIAQKYGRIINVSSASGLYGNFGQANYAAAKMAAVGFTQTLAKEGANKNIKVNVIAPLAGTRMSGTVMPKEVLEALKPEFVAPVVGYLCHDDCVENGTTFEVGAGWFTKVRWQRAQGCFLPRNFTIEDVASNIDIINDFSKPNYPTNLQDSMQVVVQQIEMGSKSGAGGDTTSSSESTGLKSGTLLKAAQEFMKTPQGADVVKKVGFVYRFDILPKKGAQPISVTFDLKNGKGKIEIGAPEKFDAQFTMLDDDFMKIINGQLNPQIAFMQGKMKIKGNMKAATKFQPSLFPKLSKL